MVYAVVELDKSETEVIIRDDILSRQSISIKDAPRFGGTSGRNYILIEGDNTILERLKELKMRPMLEKKANGIREMIKKEEDEAAGGIGFLFG